MHQREDKCQQVQYLQKMNCKQLDLHSKNSVSVKYLPCASDGNVLGNPNEFANYLIKAKLPGVPHSKCFVMKILCFGTAASKDTFFEGMWFGTHHSL